MADHDRTIDRSRNLDRVRDVVVQTHAADVGHGPAAMVAAQVEGVALVSVPGEELLIRLPVPRAAEHAVYEQHARFGGGNHGPLDGDRQVTDSRDVGGRHSIEKHGGLREY